MVESKIETTNILIYTGKVREVSPTQVRVSLFDSRNREKYIGEFPKSYFPSNTKLKVGDIFKYHSTISIEMVEPRVPSESELAEMRRKIEKELPRGTY